MLRQKNIKWACSTDMNLEPVLLQKCCDSEPGIRGLFLSILTIVLSKKVLTLFWAKCLGFRV